jgi:transcriptional antiterminator RfaH
MNHPDCSSSDSIRRTLDIWGQSHWFAIHAKTRRENFAVTNVNALSIRVLFPLLKVGRPAHGVALLPVKPLFPGYFFARFCPRDSLELVERARGVLRVVSSGRFPIPVEDDVVRQIQERIEEDGFITLHQRPLKPGETVSIQGGPFEGLLGRVERESDDRSRVAILLETLLHARVLIEKRWLESVAA